MYHINNNIVICKAHKVSSKAESEAPKICYIDDNSANNIKSLIKSLKALNRL